MGVAEDLKTLQELHGEGSLTDQEYANAKNATLTNQASPTAKNTPARYWTRRTTVLLVIFVMFIIGCMWYVNGIKGTNNILAAAVHAPTTMTDEVENLPAHSMKGIGFNVPYDCSVGITIEVAHGNPIDLFLIDASQLGAAQRSAGRGVQSYADFNATKATSYSRTARLKEGSYYLMMRDRSLGIFSASASDVSVKIQLNP
jgi:hypothetical protein